MTTELIPFDIRSNPELARLADEVRATGKPRVLRRGDEDVAVLIPAATPKPTARKRHGRSPLDESFGAIPPLVQPLSVEEMTEIAAEEHAWETAHEGLQR
jgi:hypothetical protein